MISTKINVNRPYGTTHSQMVYVLKYSPQRTWFLRLLEVNVLHSEHLIYHKNHQEPLIYGVLQKNKCVTFHSWGRRLIPESLVPEENVNITTYKHTYIKTYPILITVRYNDLHGPRSFW